MDVTTLLTARDSDGASGENLEYDPDFMELQRLASPGEERQAGSEILAAEEPDFQDVELRALAILERSHDLRAAVMLADARLNTKGIVGFADAVAYVRGCLADFWDTCHPQLDADDDNDPTMRINAVVGLAGANTTLKYLRRAPLTQSRNFGRLSLRDIQIGLGEFPAVDDSSPSYDRAAISAAFADTPDEILSAMLAAAKQIQADLKAIDGIFSDQTPGQGPDLDELRRMMQQVVRHLADHASAAPETSDEADEDNQDDAPSAPVRRGGGGGMSGSIDTAQDARATIDRVIDYFRRNEPSSPVPIILERAKRLVGADFLTIIKDMAPNGLDSVLNIGGIEEEDDD